MGSSPGLEPCYANDAKAYRQQMAGAWDAKSLPPATGNGFGDWSNMIERLTNVQTRIEQALNKADAAHQGAAANAGQRAMAEIKPLVASAQQTVQGVRDAIPRAVDQMNQTFHSLPAPGQKLDNGQDAVFDHPDKGFWDQGWNSWMGFGDYDDKMSAFQATNQHAAQVMNTYQGQSQTTIAQTPQFQPPPPPPGSNQAAPGTGMGNANSALAGSHGSGSSMHSGSAAGAGSHLAGGAAGGAAHGWNPGGAAGTGAQGAGAAAGAGAGGALDGAGAAGPGFAGDLGMAGAGAGIGGAAGMASRGGAGAGRGFGGSARGSAGAGGAKGGPGAGGRAGVGTGGGNAAENAGAGARGANAAGARGPMGGSPMGGARGGHGQGGDEQEHTRPSWLIETDDVFGDGVPRVAPPVLGE